ncbi:unnamed protein product [Peniophora sp. CBMAI 1063]|nr:unnamed protein product [Peniophora sp. CBMAI 1063]
MSSSSRAKAEKGSTTWESQQQPADPSSYSRAILLARYSVNTLAWLIVVVFASFLAVQCDRYLALRQLEAPASHAHSAYDISSNKDELEIALERVSDTYRVDDIITELEALGDTLDGLTPAPIRLDGTDVYPTDSICLREGFGDADVGDWVTSPPATYEFNDGERYRFRATGHLAFARDVRIYMVDTGYDPDVRADLHVVSGAVPYATVDVAAFSNEQNAGAGTLDAFEACTHRLDSAPESLTGDSRWLSGSEYDPLKIDLFRLQHRKQAPSDAAGDNSSPDVRFNVTLTVPEESEELYSLRIGYYNITLHNGVILDELDVQTSGSVHAESGFKTIRLGVRTVGAQGSVTGHYDVMNGDVAIHTDGAPVDARIDAVRTTTKNRKTPTQNINVVATDAKLTVELLLEDQADDCDPAFAPAPNCAWVRPFAFDVRTTSSNHPQRLTILDGSSYSAGTRILARATNAPAKLKLDSSFEGTYALKTGKHALGAGISGEPGVDDPNGWDRQRVFVHGLGNRHVFSGAVGWGSKDAAMHGPSYAEVEIDEGMFTADVDIRPSAKSRYS